MRDARQRLDDVLAAAAAIRSHVGRGTLADGLVFDAVRVRLIEIGEAVKDIDLGLLAEEPHVPWQDVAGMRDHLAHRYFDTDHAIVAATLEQDLPPLVAAAQRLRARLGATDDV
ncbi:MAG TPA: HepT-like ribonuclease domain-containing protein [Acidimicrobiales bacterium]